MTKTDAWILAAVGSEELISLDQLVASADFLNRLIPDGTEVEEAVNHLTKAGLAQVQGRRFRMTAEGRAWLDRFGWESGRDVISVWMKLAQAWKGQELPLKDPTSNYRLKPGELEAAVALHHKYFHQWLAKERRGKSGGDRGHGTR
jgi:hypothetical protein